MGLRCGAEVMEHEQQVEGDEATFSAMEWEIAVRGKNSREIAQLHESWAAGAWCLRWNTAAGDLLRDKLVQKMFSPPSSMYALSSSPLSCPIVAHVSAFRVRSFVRGFCRISSSARGSRWL